MNAKILQFKPREQLYLLYSDNFDGDVVTSSALKEIKLQMSTGDYHTHIATPIEYDSAMELINSRGIDGPITLNDLI